MRKVLLCLVVLAAVGVQAETHLGGELTKTTLEAIGNPYIVEQDVSIPAGQRVMVKAGCVFLFKPFTGMQVHGSLTVEGSVDNPVVFTSINDEEFNPQSTQLANPFDWNGILITPAAQSVAIKNFTLRFSVYGIKSQTPSITIQNGKFKQNGQFHFTINDKIQYVQDELFYSYGVEDEVSADDAKPVKKTKAAKKPKGGGKDSPGKSVFRWGSFGIGVVGIGVGTTMLIMSAGTLGDLVEVDDEIKRDLTNPELRQRDSELRSKFDRQRLSGIILESIGALGATGFGISFAF